MNKYYKIGHDTPRKEEKKRKRATSNEGCRDIHVGCMK